jgi:hypothetical protein
MKKLVRRDAGIDYVKLLAEHSRRVAVATYSAEAIKEFGDELQRSLAATAEATHRIEGLRTEALFGAVVTALGDVSLLKAEDTGDIFYNGEDLQVPDYRIITRERVQLLVEVKTSSDRKFPPKPMSFSHNYIERLRRYAELAGAELRVAIFWQGTGQWTLSSLAAFSAGSAGEQKWRLSYWRALATNEMATLGDRTIATPPPLRFRVLFNPDKSDHIAPGATGDFTVSVRGIRLLSRSKELSGMSAQIAWKLLWYGTWDELPPEDHYENGRLLWIDYPCAPSGWDENNPDHQGMAPIGGLSEMVSQVYLRSAVGTIHTSATDKALEPGYMREFIPADFVKQQLQIPIAMFTLQPNYEFDEAKHVKGFDD